jgi:hypothetical protein
MRSAKRRAGTHLSRNESEEINTVTVDRAQIIASVIREDRRDILRRAK